MADPVEKAPTLADIEAIPPGMKGEIIEGEILSPTTRRHNLLIKKRNHRELD